MCIRDSIGAETGQHSAGRISADALIDKGAAGCVQKIYPVLILIDTVSLGETVA